MLSVWGMDGSHHSYQQRVLVVAHSLLNVLWTVQQEVFDHTSQWDSRSHDGSDVRGMPWCVCGTCPATAHRRTLIICHSQQRRLSPTRCESMWNLRAAITECIFWRKGVQPMWTSCRGTQMDAYYRRHERKEHRAYVSVFVRLSEVPSPLSYSAHQEEWVELSQWPTRCWSHSLPWRGSYPTASSWDGLDEDYHSLSKHTLFSYQSIHQTACTPQTQQPWLVSSGKPKTATISSGHTGVRTEELMWTGTFHCSLPMMRKLQRQVT